MYKALQNILINFISLILLCETLLLKIQSKCTRMCQLFYEFDFQQLFTIVFLFLFDFH